MSKIKILHFDLESAPNVAYVWGLFKETVPIQRLIETGRVMCWAAKWHGQRELIFSSEWDDGHEQCIKNMHDIFAEADAIVHYNGNRFDLPVANKEFLMYGMEPPQPAKQIDLFNTVKSRFRFPSKKLDYVAQQLGLGKKTQHEGFELWVKCMSGDEVAQRKMARYNKQDVRLLEKLYKKLLPWIKNHPNHALYKDNLNRPVCTNCGSHHVQSRGVEHTKTQTYRRWNCQSCGNWMRGRTNITEEQHKAHTLVGVS